MLCCIDFQHEFLASMTRLKLGRQKVVNAAQRQIARARRNSEDVLIVEYWGGYSPTIRPIMRAVEGYPLAHFIKKDDPDGHEEILSYCEAKKIAIREITFIGGELLCCLFETALAMRNSLPEVPMKIHMPACYHGYLPPADYLESSLGDFRRAKIEIVDPMRSIEALFDTLRDRENEEF